MEPGRRGGRCEQPLRIFGGDDHAQLEIFAIVERMIKCGYLIVAAHFAGIGMYRDGRSVEDGAESAAFREDVAQVGR